MGLEQENIFDFFAKVPGNFHRQHRRGYIIVFFHRIDGLSGAAHKTRQIFLGDVGNGALYADVIFHRSSNYGWYKANNESAR